MDARTGERDDVHDATHLVEAEVWLHPSEGGWHFVTMPPDVADDIRARSAASARPFGTVPARVTLGSTTWSTPLFADTRSGSYLLPIKAAVLARESVAKATSWRSTSNLIDPRNRLGAARARRSAST